MALNVAIISKNDGLEALLSQHNVVHNVVFSTYDGIESYASGGDFVIFDGEESEVEKLDFGSNNVVYLFKKPEAKYHLSKPFRIADLFILLKKMIEEGTSFEEISVGAYKFNYAKKILSGGEKEINLTEKEAEIIMVLLDARPHAMDKKELLNSVWGYDDGIDTHTLETHMYRLRKKMGDGNFIITEKDGYKII
jgi:hypothetical protein